MTAATVVIPTHDHGPLLARAARSALSQTVCDIELLIIGDGATAATRDVATGLAADTRVRFFDFPKSPRTGEPYRHTLLRDAQGEVVAYLGDDDLWLPTHLAEMLRLLESADFAHAQPMLVTQEGALDALGVDLAVQEHREALRAGHNAVPLSCVAHTLDFYRGLPHGWRTAPPGIATDLYMWQQVLAQPSVRIAAAVRPTVLVFPSPWRQDWPTERRVAELDAWAARLEEPGLAEELADEVARQLIAGHGRQLRGLRAALAERDETIRELQMQMAEQTAWARRASADATLRDATIRELQARVTEQTAWARRASADASLRDATIRELQARVTEQTTWALRSSEEVAVRDGTIRELQARVTEQTTWALRLSEEVADRDGTIRELQAQLDEATNRPADSPGA